MGLLTPDARGVRRAVELLRAGRVVAFPTDTVYGLAALARDAGAVRQVFEVKGRPPGRPLILMAAEPGLLEGWADVDERARAYMRRWWPGPLTLVMTARPGAEPPLTSPGPPPTIAARIPDHPVALALLRAVGEPVATTSANRSGEPPALTAAEAAAVSGLAAVLDGGRAPGEVPSTLLDVSGPDVRILRRGSILESDLLLP